MKALVVFVGASFRYGSQNTTNRGIEQAYEGQMEACYSHIHFLQYLEYLGYDVDVFVNTYTTRYDDALKNVYSKYLCDMRTHPDLIGWTNLIQVDTVNMIKQYDINIYDFIFIIRIDLFLKPKFIELFKRTEKLTFSSVCCRRRGWHTINGTHRIADMMAYIPKRLFGLITNGRFTLTHDSYSEHIIHGNLAKEDMDFVLDTYHDSDSEKDWNPIYRIVNRPESTIWHSEGMTLHT